MNKYLPHILSLTILFAVIVVVCKPLFQTGYIYHTDVTEGLTVDNLHERYIYTYSNDLGESLAEKARIPIFYTIFGLYKVAHNFGLEDSGYVKIKILTLFISSALAFFITSKKFIKEFNKESPVYITLASALIGSLYYIVNYWFANRITHFGLFFTTVTLPVTFYLLHSYLFNKYHYFKPLILLAVFLGIFSATPHTILFIFIIFSVLLITFLLSSETESKLKVQKTLVLVAFAFVYLFVNAYWILPYASAQTTPDAVLSETIVKVLGRYGSIERSVNLTGYWLTTPDGYYMNGLMMPQKVISYLPLVLTLITIVFYRKERTVWLPLSMITAAGIFLATTSVITNTFYFWLMFDSPIKNMGWLFREYDKFGLLLVFSYSLSITLLIPKLFKSKIALTISAVFVALILSNNLYFMNKTMAGRYTPVQIPDDFETVSWFLEKDQEEYNTIWYPGVPTPYWAKNEEVRFVFSNLVSPKPSIMTQSVFINYLEFIFEEENIYSINIGKALDMLGVKYLIFRNDEKAFTKHPLTYRMEFQKSLEKVMETPELTVYKNNDFSGLVKVINTDLVSSEGLKTLRYLDQLNYKSSTSLVTYIDKDQPTSNVSKKYFVQENNKIDIGIIKYQDKFIYPAQFTNLKDDGDTGFWKFGSLEDKNHAETGYLLENLGISKYQFDHKNMVLIAREGWQKKEQNKPPVQTYELSFSEHPNISKSDNTLNYSSQDSDFQYYWNIIRTDRIPTTSAKALEVKFKSQISSALLPHYKMTFYDSQSKVLEIHTIYADDRNRIQDLIRIPEGTQEIDFSIWTQSGVGTPYSYALDVPQIQDISNNVKPVDITHRVKTGCLNECVLYARVLKNHQGGEVNIEVNGVSYPINTLISEETPELERFEWVKVGSYNNLEIEENINLINTKGLNAVNAMVFLSPHEEKSLVPFIENVTTLPETTPARIKVKQITPSKYEVKLLDNINQPTVLTFAKPFSSNWELSGSETKTIEVNGYINGWEIDGLQSGTYYIQHRPQRFFDIGLVVSAITASILLGSLGIRSLNQHPKDKFY